MLEYNIESLESEIKMLHEILKKEYDIAKAKEERKEILDGMDSESDLDPKAR